MTFDEFVHAAGLRPRSIPADGRWHRCPTVDHPRKRNGAFKLATDGLVGWCQDWATQAEPATWRPDSVTAAAPIDARAVREAQRRQQEEMAQAIRAAQAYYAGAAPLIGGHPYLEAHGLDMTGCRGLKRDAKGWLVVPAWRRGTLVTVQRIAPDGTKRFWSGAPAGGASYTIDRRGAALTVLCEGLATGLALYAAVPQARVVVAFNSGNLAVVAPELPLGLCVVAADNDVATAARIGRNPGVEEAQYAAKLLGCGVAIPEGIEGTDWADYRRERTATRLERLRRGETAHAALRAVEAEIAGELMRHARLRARQKETA